MNLPRLRGKKKTLAGAGDFARLFLVIILTAVLRNQSRRFLRIPKRNLPHLSTFASFHQDTILHTQVVHQWQVRLMHSQIRE